MAGEWPLFELANIARLRSGFPFKSESWTDEGVPVIKISNVKDGRIVRDGCGFVSLETAMEASEWTTAMGDILMAMTGYVGEVARVREGEHFLINQRVGRFEFLENSPVSPGFLYCYLRHPEVRAQVEMIARGSAQPNLSSADAAKLLVPAPPLPEQRAIAHILGTLDDKIELNRRRNQTLEAMACALFKDWFVDFGPVRAKMEARDPYLPADHWQHFPDRLDDEGKPEGWEKKRVSDFLSLAYGKSLPAGKRHLGDIPVYGSGGITGFHNEALVNGPVVIVGRKGTVGSLYWDDRPCFPIDTVFFVQPDARLSFCYYLLESLPLRDMNTDAAVPGLNRENVYRLEVTAPSAELVSGFSETASRFRASIAAIFKDSEALAQLRDTLLPKLMSGELRIADAERFLETRP